MLIAPFRAARDLLVTIPDVDTLVAGVIIGETGADLSVFLHPGISPPGRRHPRATTDGCGYIRAVKVQHRAD